MGKVRVIELGPNDDRAAVFRIRHTVFVEEQHVPIELERDDYDAVAVFVLAFDGTRPVGTGRLVRLAPNMGKIGRVAVLRHARHMGVGRAVMTALEDAAVRMGLATAQLSAQIEAVEFYERLGYTCDGATYFEAGIAHRHMTKNLNAVHPG